ncbi:MAG: hypothetical protein ACRC92_18160 [Peptostreptococcaceae bacterium]
MDIRLEEIKKVISSPIVIALTTIFVLFNILVIYENSYLKNDFKVINQIVKEFGYEIDDEMLANMDSKYEKDLQKFNEIAMNKFQKQYETVADFCNSNEYYSNNYDGSIFTKEERNFIEEVNILEMYVNLSRGLIDSYENIDWMDVAKTDINMYGLSGKAADMVYKNYEKFSLRFEELVKNNEHKNVFFIGTFYKTHSLLFRDIFSKCIYEIMILVVLITAYLVNYEFDNKTSLLVYSTKRGRNNSKDKFIVCILSAIIISLIIIGLTLIAYFITFDYSQVLNVNISSVFNWEYTLPFVSWFDISFRTYLILCILVSVFAAVVFSGISYIISKLMKNSYLVFFVFFIVFGGFMILPSVISKSSSLFIYSHYNIFNLILNPHAWFTSLASITMSKYYELITLIVSIVVVSIGGILVFNRFRKEDLC